MITKNHPSAYAKLFEKAKEVLRSYAGAEENIIIDDIDDYFKYIKTLAEIEKNDPNLDPIFTILPATEETFNIDANTRIISIPSNFAKYGVAVKGDEIAEILYFSIDRYFDAMDMADMDILVQWKHENDEDHVAYLSATYKKSLTLQPGKVVFGWPITSEITDRVGNINFSIRFYRRDPDEDILLYSFSTLTATIKIQPGLDFEINSGSLQLITDKSGQIYNNLRNSTINGVDSSVAKPAFVERWVLNGDILNAVQAEAYNTIVPLVARASIPLSANENDYKNASGLTYSWYLESDPDTLLPESSSYYRLVDTVNETYNKYDIYYENVEGVYTPYAVLGDDNIFDNPGVTLYVKCSVFTPTIAGKYYAVAENRQSLISAESVVSDSWEIAGPGIPTFEYKNENQRVLLNVEGTATVEIVATADSIISIDEWYKGPNAVFSNVTKIDEVTGDNCDVTEEGYYFRKVINTKNGVSCEAISLPVWVRYKASTPIVVATSGSQVLGNALSVEVSVDNRAKGELTYQWYKDNDPIAGAIESSYTPISTGNYKCEVTNTYKDNSASATSSWLSITLSE